METQGEEKAQRGGAAPTQVRPQAPGTAGPDADIVLIGVSLAAPPPETRERPAL